MRLVVTTPTALVEEVAGVRHIRAEDETGAFGILPGHADFVTVLPVSVVTWRGEDGGEGFVLVRGGVLTVRGGDLVEIAARGAYRADDLADLGDDALAALERLDVSEDEARTSETRLHLATMRQIERVLQSGRQGKSAPPSLDQRRADGSAANG
ncbi:F0F1 ATP synthase subunit epsilon [Rhodovulum marinum]|uniref:ATP synthase epsilon chain n=1 Tax=Rhodovulum marinum TaxID=320662 RepID=A0A4R2PVJ1_9RHOB|nr:F0F1 ATP synthase subunit epsilon [Rhodovulum marinum]TCP39969.1 F-type H+-transporting ATPase subunit epsilon [Rhodovulum marinum]